MRFPESHRYCPNCAAPYGQASKAKFGELTCSQCRRVVYFSPVASVVAVCPVYDNGDFLGLMGTVRGIEPEGLALPGGYIDYREDWKTALGREFREETGIDLYGKELTLRNVISAPHANVVLVFGNVEGGISVQEIDFGFQCKEVAEVLILKEPVEMAFNSQTEIIEDFFKRLPS